MSDQVEVWIQNEDESLDKVEERLFMAYPPAIGMFEKGLAINPDNFSKEEVAALKADIMACGAMLTAGIRGLIALLETSREVAKFTGATPPVIVGETA